MKNKSDNMLASFINNHQISCEFQHKKESEEILKRLERLQKKIDIKVLSHSWGIQLCEKAGIEPKAVINGVNKNGYVVGDIWVDLIYPDFVTNQHNYKQLCRLAERYVNEQYMTAMLVYKIKDGLDHFPPSSLVFYCSWYVCGNEIFAKALREAKWEF